MKKSSKFGFTLIELLVAMTILAVLMAISLVSYQGAKKSARDGKRKADLEQIRSALEIYRTDCKTYPTSLNFGSPLTGTTEICAGNTYMEEVPKDPGSCNYSYTRSGANSYTLCASLEVGGGTVTGCGSCGSGCTCNYKVTNP
ncbi:MAG: type II secretion system protein [Candidatus Margulisiibacteriota bacterium]